jgi:hypothetical protein
MSDLIVNPVNSFGSIPGWVTNIFVLDINAISKAYFFTANSCCSMFIELNKVTKELSETNLDVFFRVCNAFA